jgi:hypothetical protein
VMLNLKDQPRPRAYSVAALLLSTFVGPKPSRRYRASYLDGNRTNLAISNLTWLTPHQNRLLAIKNGRGGGWEGRKGRIAAICADRMATAMIESRAE